MELRGKFVGREASGVWVQVLGEVRGQIGQLFTGVNGLHCPAGLLVGEVRQVIGDGERLLVDRSEPEGHSVGQGVFVFTGVGS